MTVNSKLAILGLEILSPTLIYSTSIANKHSPNYNYKGSIKITKQESLLKGDSIFIYDMFRLKSWVS